MKAFDRRWETLVARSRRALASKAEDTPPPPPGFATRVVALAADARKTGTEAWALELWIRRTRQALAVVTLLGLMLLAFDRPTTRHKPLSTPGIENTVAQILWRL